MIYLFTLFVTGCTLIYLGYKVFIVKNFQIIKNKEKILLDSIKDFNVICNHCDNFYKSQTYQVAIGYLKLKLLQQDMIDALDPVLDDKLIVELSLSINKLDNYLKELGFLTSKNIVDTKSNSLIESFYFDESQFSKN